MVESVKLMRCFVLSDGRCSLKSNTGNTERLEMVNHFKDRNRNEPGQDAGFAACCSWELVCHCSGEHCCLCMFTSQLPLIYTIQEYVCQGHTFLGKRTFLNSMQNVSTLNTLGIRVNWIERKCSVENSSYLYSDFTGNTGLSLVLKAVIVAQLC